MNAAPQEPHLLRQKPAPRACGSPGAEGTVPLRAEEQPRCTTSVPQPNHRCRNWGFLSVGKEILWLMNAVAAPRDAFAIFLLLHRPSKEELMPFCFHPVGLKKKKKAISSTTRCSSFRAERQKRAGCRVKNASVLVLRGSPCSASPGRAATAPAGTALTAARQRGGKVLVSP